MVPSGGYQRGRPGNKVCFYFSNAVWRFFTVVAARGGRHPLLEQASEGDRSFVANPTRMGADGSGESRTIVLTGLNACGKSVYLKQAGDHWRMWREHFKKFSFHRLASSCFCHISAASCQRIARECPSLPISALGSPRWTRCPSDCRHSRST